MAKRPSTSALIAQFNAKCLPDELVRRLTPAHAPKLPDGMQHGQYRTLLINMGQEMVAALDIATRHNDKTKVRNLEFAVSLIAILSMVPEDIVHMKGVLISDNPRDSLFLKVAQYYDEYAKQTQERIAYMDDMAKKDMATLERQLKMAATTVAARSGMPLDAGVSHYNQMRANMVSEGARMEATAEACRIMDRDMQPIIGSLRQMDGPS